MDFPLFSIDYNPVFDRQPLQKEDNSFSAPPNSPVRPEPEPANFVAKLDQRARQILLGKITPLYYFLQAYGIPSNPPEGNLDQSKREFDFECHAWRRSLHKKAPFEVSQNNFWVSPALQYAFDQLRNCCVATTPQDLVIERQTTLPYRILQHIDDYFVLTDKKTLQAHAKVLLSSQAESSMTKPCDVITKTATLHLETYQNYLQAFHNLEFSLSLLKQTN